MLFNSFDFAIFFGIFVVLYFALRSRVRYQNLLLLAGSLLFYGWWDYRFLALILAISAGTYVAGKFITNSEDERARKLWLIGAIIFNLTFLGFFKYFDFFVESTADVLTFFGLAANIHVLGILLPIGISFYVFEAVSYLVDIYRRHTEPAKRYTDFLLFLAFFPHLIAGPIMRAKQLLPQIEAPRIVTAALFHEGTYLFLWGLFKKVFVADNLGKFIVDPAFASGDLTGFGYMIALYAFGFQIYADFSGYTDMARGIARWLGFDLPLNFDAPYFSRNPSDFWRRWHITLSNWYRDYVYIPLGGNRGGVWKTCLNLILTMLLAGLWHGASWTYVVWGGYQGLLLAGHRLWVALNERSSSIKRVTALFGTAGAIILMLQATMIGWLPFRAQSFEQVRDIGSAILFNFAPNATPLMPLLMLIFFSAILLIAEFFQYRLKTPFILWNASLPLRVFAYLLAVYSILVFGVLAGAQFIYFQF